MLWIGLTGGLGSGKSTVAEILRRRGHLVIDADELAHLALGQGQSAYNEIIQRFGREVIDAHGEIQRPALAKKVFGHAAELKALEDIIHPIVRRMARDRRKQAESRGLKWAFYDVPLLFEKLPRSDFDVVVVVAANDEIRIQRAITRSGLNQEEVRSRLDYQMPLKEKVKLADFVILNEGSVVDLEGEVDGFLKKLSNLPTP
jgi:dephospho-CoA kinase